MHINLSLDKNKALVETSALFLVPMTGLEPVRYRYRGILSPLCLPIPPHRRIYNDIIFNYLCQEFFLTVPPKKIGGTGN